LALSTLQICPFSVKAKGGQGITASEMRFCHWVEPELVCQIKFSELTRDERVRHPDFLGLREDKEAKDGRASRRGAAGRAKL
jgi:bifunctional non-homologous end joining protein LigD